MDEKRFLNVGFDIASIKVYVKMSETRPARHKLPCSKEVCLKKINPGCLHYQT